MDVSSFEMLPKNRLSFHFSSISFSICVFVTVHVCKCDPQLVI